MARAENFTRTDDDTLSAFLVTGSERKLIGQLLVLNAATVDLFGCDTKPIMDLWSRVTGEVSS